MFLLLNPFGEPGVVIPIENRNGGLGQDWAGIQLDAGPILAQAAVPVLDGDDYARLAKRIQEQEHLLLPRALAELKPTWRQG